MHRIKVTLLLFFVLMFTAQDIQAQDDNKSNLYFKLDSTAIKYEKKISSHVSSKNKTEFSAHSILIDCDCHIRGWLAFLGHTNEEVGNTSEPPQIITHKAYKKLELISFTELIQLLQQHDLRFNDIYNLYLVEPCVKKKREYTLYNVRFRNSFIEQQ